MKPYQNLSRDSGVVAYESGPDFILVEFTDGTVYRYDHETTGGIHVERMKELAERGKGLSSYIARHVRERYASKS